MGRAILGAAAALLLHAAVVVWMTWPLGAHLATHLPNSWSVTRSDTLVQAWVLAYQSHRLITAPAAFPHANIYHPAPDALFYGETGFGMLPFFLPVYALSGNPTLALNLAFLAAVTLSAWTLYLVVRHWTGSPAGGLAASWTFLSSRWVLWTFFPTAPQYAVLPYFPLIVYWAATPEPRLRRTLRLLPLIVLQGLDTVYVAAAVLAPLGLLGLLRLLRAATRRAGVNLTLVCALASLLVVAAYSGQLLVLADNPSLRSQTVWVGSGTRPVTLPWEPFARGAPMGVPSVLWLVVGAGAGSAWLRSRRESLGPGRSAWVHGAFWTVVGLFISLTPTASWNGAVISMPQHLVAEWLPLYRTLREPNRLGVAGLMGLAVLTGVATAECTRRLRAVASARGLPPPLVATVPLLVLWVTFLQYRDSLGMASSPVTAARADFAFHEHLPRTYPLQQAIGPEAPLVDLLRATDGPLLEVPVPEGSGLRVAVPHARAQYRSIFHWRPLLNGYHGYYPAGFPARMRTARQLPDPEALRVLHRETGLATVLVHTRSLTPPQRAAWFAAAAPGARADLRLRARERNHLLFDVTLDPPQ